MPFIKPILASAVKCPEVDDDEDDKCHALNQVGSANEGKQVNAKQGKDCSQFDCCPLAPVGRHRREV